MCFSNNLVRPAHLLICWCGQHGRIVTSQGTPSPEVCYQREAAEIAKNLLQNRLVVIEEYKALLRQINSSMITMIQLLVREEMLAAVEQYNQQNAADPQTHLDPHEFISNSLREQGLEWDFTEPGHRDTINIAGVQ